MGQSPEGPAVKYVGLTQAEAEAILDMGQFKLQTNKATRAFVLKIMRVVLEFDSDKDEMLRQAKELSDTRVEIK